MLHKRVACFSLLLSCLLVPATAAPANSSSKPVDFDRDIRPIISDKCFACHGPDEKQRMANLRLDKRDGFFTNRGSYQIVVPGDSGKSRLYQRISSDKKSFRMPPVTSGRNLTPDQIDLIRRWIDQGAKWEAHWAYIAPKRPPIPEVQDKKWPKNPIDDFVLAKLEHEGLKPSPEADKATLLRRVSFDLTGLPPTPEELKTFLADKSPNAYEKQVDRLLASPHYGERMAMQWLDLARYADTHGYHIDSAREMWHWRDWVVKAYNRNMPFDEFTIEQLAGDLLPNPTTDQLIATGFNRNHMINFEGGAIPAEYQNEYVVDRVEATSTTFLGITLGCARCHDHKYDPFKQKEFYEFYAFFNNIPEKGLDGRTGNAKPYLQLPSPEQKQRLEELTSAIESREKQMDETKIAALQTQWEKTAQLPDATREGLTAHYELDGSFADTSGHYLHGRVVRGELGYGEGAVNDAVRFSGEAQVQLPGAGNFDRNSPFSLALWVKYTTVKDVAVLQKLDATPERRGYEVLFDTFAPLPELKRGSHLVVRLIHHAPDDEIVVRTKDRLAQNSWMHAGITYDGSGKASGVKLYINGKPVETTIEKDTLTGSFASARPLEIGDKELGNPYQGQLDDLRLYNRPLNAVEMETLAIHYPIREMLAGDTAKLSAEKKAQLREYYLTYVAPEPYRTLHRELARLTVDKRHLEEQIPTTMVMAEMDKPRETVVLGRGDYRNRGEKVSPGVPAILPPLPKGAPLNRLTLAKWIVDPANPLTARVAVNRYWQMYFGLGIVKTAENFGSQGDPPSNQELLDWLATEFERTHWDIKGMQRLIVTSATYRQSSRTTPEMLERDPENRLLAHGPRFRLPAEMIRDNALAVSGLLNTKMGGPGVYPYQPKGLWEDIAYGDVYSAQHYVQSHGDDLYRRSMYIFWKRTSPPPALLTFDAPSREKCTARRGVTNTPLQALVLLNDPTYIESARMLAERTLRDGGHDANQRIRYAFRLATERTPTPKEIQVLRGLEQQELTEYRANKTDAEKLLAVGEAPRDTKLDSSELAAWTTVASTILNLDETVTKE
ncbi:MAG TPA: DUF1553 domain-containing protein [Bryobacteraceae bacterium]|nr:DUF1553 domain-containing protein [Bryobacteraceae bacterium]